MIESQFKKIIQETSIMNQMQNKDNSQIMLETIRLLSLEYISVNLSDFFWE